MELILMTRFEPMVVFAVFCAISLIVLIIAISKVTLELSNKKKKGEAKDDNRGNKKRSTKTNVHKSR